MAQPEMAMAKLNELREVAPEEVEDVIDGLATLLVLRQDVSNPMFGAKVTLHLRPETERHRCPADDIPEDIDNWQIGPRSDDPENWRDWDYPWLDGEPDEEPEGVAIVKVKSDPEAPDIVNRRALVFDPTIAEADGDVAYWDPNREEYTTPDEYPLGTVNVVVAGEPDREFERDYTSDVEVHTSVVPADGEPTAHTYTPGW